MFIICSYLFTFILLIKLSDYRYKQDSRSFTKKIKKHQKHPEMDFNEKVAEILQNPNNSATENLASLDQIEVVSVPSFLLNPEDLGENNENIPLETVNEDHHNNNVQNQLVFVEPSENQMEAKILDMENKIQIMKDEITEMNKSIAGIHVKLDQILKLVGGSTHAIHQSDVIFTKDLEFPLQEITDVEKLNTMLNSEEVKNEMVCTYNYSMH